jgi:L-fuculose-phosphate aldolase
MALIDENLAKKLATACNILAAHGHGNLTMGHISARRPDQRCIHMNPHDLGLEEIVADDIILIDFDGIILEGSGRRHSEYPIHAEIYKTYPQINCVVHTHPFYSIIIGATEGCIRPISHEGSIFSDIPLFKETALLIRTAELGHTVAEYLDGHRAMLMQNHGIVVVGESIEEAAVYAILLERAAKLQVLAAGVGPLHTTKGHQISDKKEQVFYPQNINGFWEYLVRNFKAYPKA